MASADFVGIEGLTVSVQTLAVLVNQKSGTLGNGTVAVPNSVYADFSASAANDGQVGTALAVKTGPTSTLSLDMDGKELIEASGSLSLGVFGFFYLGGNFAFTKTTDTVTLSDGTSQPVSLLTVGASNVNAFAGINGPYILSDNAPPATTPMTRSTPGPSGCRCTGSTSAWP